MSQPKIPRHKFYAAIATFAISQLTFILKLIGNDDVILDTIFITAILVVMFFLISLGLRWARWVLTVFLTFFILLSISSTILNDDYVWLFPATGYIATIVLIFQVKRLPSNADETHAGEEPAALNTGSFTSNGIEYDYPQLITRIQALFIDGMIILTTMVVTMVLLDESEYRSTVMITLGALGIFLYEPLLTVSSGTIGQRVMDIRVRDFKDPSKKLGLMQAYGRVVAKSLLGWLSFLTINFNPQHRAIHDFVGGSVMVNSAK
jgi:uncharacterized RDD family membrane protein YckC